MFKRITRRLFLNRSTKIAATGAILGACRSTDRPFREDHASAELGLTGGSSVATYDYIVIGSGAGGGPLACNLAKAGYQVLLLEAGDDQSATLTYQIPALNAQEAEEPDASWRFFVKHYTDPNRQKQDEKYSAKDGGVFYPRAGTVGGCTAHNALITVYPHASDWDHVANLTGDKSWLAKNMRPYFVRLERCAYLSGEALKGHGLKGWLATKTSNPLLIAADRVIVASIFSAALVFNKAAFHP